MSNYRIFINQMFKFRFEDKHGETPGIYYVYIIVTALRSAVEMLRARVCVFISTKTRLWRVLLYTYTSRAPYGSKVTRNSCTFSFLFYFFSSWIRNDVKTLRIGNVNVRKLLILMTLNNFLPTRVRLKWHSAIL
jgi:hypothetical protein